MAHKSMKDSYVLKKPVPEQRLNVILTSLNNVHATVDDVNFFDGLECVYVKYKSRTSTAHELPD